MSDTCPECARLREKVEELEAQVSRLEKNNGALAASQDQWVARIAGLRAQIARMEREK